MKKMRLVLFFAMVLIDVQLAQSQGLQDRVKIGGYIGENHMHRGLRGGVFGEFEVNEKAFLSAGAFLTVVSKQHAYRGGDLNFNYYFLKSKYDVYGLAGLNLSKGKNYRHSDVGMNMGIGTQFHLRQIEPFAEIKYIQIIGGRLFFYDNLGLSVGVKYRI